jgi:hypothetical protein
MVNKDRLSGRPYSTKGKYMTVIVATRNLDSVTTILNRDVGKLPSSGGLANTLRDVALAFGIKKTQKINGRAKSLEFTKVTDEELEILLTPGQEVISHLKGGGDLLLSFYMDLGKLNKVLADSNKVAKETYDKVYPGYLAKNKKESEEKLAKWTPGDSWLDQNHLRYLNSYATRANNTAVHDAKRAGERFIAKEAVKIATKIMDDQKTVRETKKTTSGNIHGVKVGDHLVLGYRLSQHVRVTKVTDKSFWWQEVLPDGQYISNHEYAKANFANVEIGSRGDYGDYGFTIPFAGNEGRFIPPTGHQVVTREYTGMARWKNHKPVTGWTHRPSYAD